MVTQLSVLVGRSDLFWCEHDPELSDLEIGLVGVPHSSGNGSTERDQHLGPRAVRLASTGYRRVHREFRISPWDICRIRDLGDGPLPRAMVNEACIKS